MIDLSNKIEDNLESKKQTDIKNTLDTNNKDNLINNTLDNTSVSKFSKASFDDISKDNLDEIEASNFENTLDTDSSTSEVSNAEEQNHNAVNCLALTVKKDYSLSIVKNVVLKTFKNIWRIAVSIFTLNLLKFFM